MARGSDLSPPFLLAFSVAEQSLERTPRSPSDGYPPYNVERIAGHGTDSARLRVTLAVAGFSASQIEIAQERGALVIRGRQTEDRQRLHLYRGIAARQFQRVFRLAEPMQIKGATLERGLLLVELAPADAPLANDHRSHPGAAAERAQDWQGEL